MKVFLKVNAEIRVDGEQDLAAEPFSETHQLFPFQPPRFAREVSVQDLGEFHGDANDVSEQVRKFLDSNIEMWVGYLRKKACEAVADREYQRQAEDKMLVVANSVLQKFEESRVDDENPAS